MAVHVRPVFGIARNRRQKTEPSVSPHLPSARSHAALTNDSIVKEASSHSREHNRRKHVPEQHLRPDSPPKEASVRRMSTPSAFSGDTNEDVRVDTTRHKDMVIVLDHFDDVRKARRSMYHGERSKCLAEDDYSESCSSALNRAHNSHRRSHDGRLVHFVCFAGQK